MESLHNEGSGVMPPFGDAELKAIRLGPLAAARLVIEASPSISEGLANEKAAALATIEKEVKSPDTTPQVASAFEAPLSEVERAVLSSGQLKSICSSCSDRPLRRPERWGHQTSPATAR